jgi:hypothetical protein
MTLTDWIPCTTPPVHDGWYDVQRKGFFGTLLRGVERVRFQYGSWDQESCKSKIAVWTDVDYWRGVTEESKGGE